MTTILASEQIFSEISQHAGELRQLGVQRLALFGSAARDEATESSDLDFLVELSPKTFDSFMAVKELLERLFNRPIDLVTSDAVKPQLRSRILQEAVYAEGF